MAQPLWLSACLLVCLVIPTWTSPLAHGRCPTHSEMTLDQVHTIMDDVLGKGRTNLGSAQTVPATRHASAEYRRRMDVNTNFKVMENMVQTTWMFVMCTTPIAILNPSLRFRFMGTATRLLALTTTGVVFLGCGEQLLQSTVERVVGLPACWSAAAVPIAAGAARITTDCLAGALFHGPFALSRPSTTKSAFRAIPGGTLLNLAFLAVMQQHYSSSKTSQPVAPSAHIASTPTTLTEQHRDAHGGVGAGARNFGGEDDGKSIGVVGSDSRYLRSYSSCGHTYLLATHLDQGGASPCADCLAQADDDGVQQQVPVNRFVRRFGPSIQANANSFGSHGRYHKSVHLELKGKNRLRNLKNPRRS